MDSPSSSTSSEEDEETRVPGFLSPVLGGPAAGFGVAAVAAPGFLVGLAFLLQGNKKKEKKKRKKYKRKKEKTQCAIRRKSPSFLIFNLFSGSSCRSCHLLFFLIFPFSFFSSSLIIFLLPFRSFIFSLLLFPSSSFFLLFSFFLLTRQRRPWSP